MFTGLFFILLELIPFSHATPRTTYEWNSAHSPIWYEVRSDFTIGPISYPEPVTPVIDQITLEILQNNWHPSGPFGNPEVITDPASPSIKIRYKISQQNTQSLLRLTIRHNIDAIKKGVNTRFYSAQLAMSAESWPTPTTQVFEVSPQQLWPRQELELSFSFGESYDEVLWYDRLTREVSFEHMVTETQQNWAQYTRSIQKQSPSVRFIHESATAQQVLEQLKSIQRKKMHESAWPRNSSSYWAAQGFLAAGDKMSASRILNQWLETGEPTPYVLLLAGLLGHSEIQNALETLRNSAFSLLTHPLSDSLSERTHELAALRIASRITGDPIPELAYQRLQDEIEEDFFVDDRYLDSESDFGFLDLIRHGVRHTDDPRVRSTVETLRGRTDLNPCQTGKLGLYGVAIKDMELAYRALESLEKYILAEPLSPQAETCDADEVLSLDLILHRNIEENIEKASHDFKSTSR